MKIVKMKLADIQPALYNPRKDLKPSDPEYEKLKRSIEEFDCVEPLIWNRRSHRLIGGHQRLKILKEKGIREFEVSVVDLNEQKEKALNLALNKIQGDWDFGKLADLLVELDDGQFDMELTGFDEKELEEIANWTPEEVKEDDFDAGEEAEKIKEPKSKRGEIYKLGRHRLMCGDATSREDVERLMDGKKADLLLTDPPYGVDYGMTNNKRYKKRSIEGDKPIDYQNILKFIPLIKFYLKNSFYICGSDKTIEKLILALRSAGAHISCLIIWAKDHPVLGMGDYNSQHEILVYGWFCDKHKFYGDHTQKTLWEIQRPIKSELHPTQKPIELCSRAIKNSSKRDDIVLDLFSGSGSVLIAAEGLNRRCFMMEIDPIYIDVIINRWEKFTGNKARLIEN